MKRTWTWHWVIAGAMAVAGSVGAQAADAGTLAPPERTSADSTFCNPLNLQYCFTPYGWNGREAADPVGVLHKGDYYLFASKSGGYWWSKDLIHWNLVPVDENYGYSGDTRNPTESEAALPVWGYNPMPVVVDGDLIYSQQLDAFYRLLDPKKGTFGKIRDRLPIQNDHWMFVDDDGRVYVHVVGHHPRGVYAYELDPNDDLKILRGPEPCLLADGVQPDKHGFFRIGPTPEEVRQIGRLTGEGAQMTKRNGRYYLQASFSGTEDPRYRDVAFVSDSPWGPFALAPDNPVSYRPTGFAHGAGNTGVFADKKGQDWRVVTSCVCVKHIFERRVSLYPAGVDADGGMYTDTYLGDLPQHGPGHRRDGPGGNLVGWMLLSHKKQATASSALDGHPAAHACDENIQSWWSANTRDKGEWLALDLGKTCRINAVQVNFAEQDTTAVKRRAEDELYHQYTVEVSDDGQAWTMLVDKCDNRRDVPHDYVQLKKPVTARHLRLTILHMAGGGKAAVRDLRVFGSGLGRPPAEVRGAVVQREKAEVRARISWPAVEGAEGYVVRWGRAPDKLHLSQDVRAGTEAVIECLTGGRDYWFVVDSFNDSGVTFGSEVVTAETR